MFGMIEFQAEGFTGGPEIVNDKEGQ